MFAKKGKAAAMSADNAASSSTISGKGSKGTAAEAKADAKKKKWALFYEEDPAAAAKSGYTKAHYEKYMKDEREQVRSAPTRSTAL